MKIKEYPKATEVNDSDAFVIETDEGTYSFSQRI